MATSIIKVYSENKSKWEKDKRVVLEWTGIVNLGQSSPVNTDANGTAIIDHSSSGTAVVYISGKKVGTMSTPGTATFTI